MKNCTNCGQQLNDEAVFCPNCGTSQAPVQQAAQVQQNVYANPAPQQQPTYANPAPQQQPAYAAQATVQQAAPAQQQQPVYNSVPVYQQNVYVQQQAPATRLRTDREWWKFLVFSLLTCGIYTLVVWCKWSSEINMTASRYDGKKTVHFALVAFLLSGITLGIYPLIWYTSFSSRVGDEARRRGMQTDLGGGTFWLWLVLGSLIIVGPFIYIAKVCKAMNYINESYNTYG